MKRSCYVCGERVLISKAGGIEIGVFVNGNRGAYWAHHPCDRAFYDAHRLNRIVDACDGDVAAAHRVFEVVSRP